MPSQPSVPSCIARSKWSAFAAVAFGTAVLVRRLRQRRSAHLVAVSGGVRLPCEVEGPDGPLALVVGHGLGSSDPSVKSHRHDAIRHIILPVLSQIGCRAAFYTARGHGDSLGWMGRGEEQFAWPRLAEDLLAVADATIGPGSRFVAAGNSMGAVTALCAALQQPHRLYRPPLLFEAREARRAALLSIAEEHGPQWVGREVLRGSAATNLPPSTDPSWAQLRNLSVPTLILCHGDDCVHPLASGVKLQELLPHATLLQQPHLESAEAAFPRELSRWLWKVASPAGDGE